MRAGPIVIFHVREQATEVAPAEYNNVVKAFRADRTDQRNEIIGTTNKAIAAMPLT